MFGHFVVTCSLFYRIIIIIKPIPFGNRAPSWIFEVRAPGYKRVNAKIEGGGRGDGEGREKPPAGRLGLSQDKI